MYYNNNNGQNTRLIPRVGELTFIYKYNNNNDMLVTGDFKKLNENQNKVITTHKSVELCSLTQTFDDSKLVPKSTAYRVAVKSTTTNQHEDDSKRTDTRHLAAPPK